MISYAQNFEDVMLARVLEGVTRGFYVDIGAMDPMTHSVTRHFYEAGWRGINVEPVPRYFARLTELRPEDINLNLAVGDVEEERDFFDVPDTGLSSFRGDLVRAETGAPGVQALPKMRVISLATLCATHAAGRTIDFLKIDVEGWEAKVIAGGDWQRFRPRVVVVEATKPNSPEPAWDDWEPVLLANGYRFVWFDGLNRFYLRDEDAVLAHHFTVPPNVFDRFENGETVRFRQERDLAVAEHARLGESHLRLVDEQARLAADHARLAEACRGLAAERDALRIEIDAIHRSRSWRLTAPLRRWFGRG